jgi:primosomal protein N' (replication factor Y)
MGMIAKIAVAAASFAIDKLYDYSVPETLEAKAKPGSRVVVPFSRGNRAPRNDL